MQKVLSEVGQARCGESSAGLEEDCEQQGKSFDIRVFFARFISIQSHCSRAQLLLLPTSKDCNDPTRASQATLLCQPELLTVIAGSKAMACQQALGVKLFSNDLNAEPSKWFENVESAVADQIRKPHRATTPVQMASDAERKPDMPPTGPE